MHSRELTLSFWVPLLIGVAFLIFGLALPALGIGVPSWAVWTALAVAVALVLFAFWTVRRSACTGTPASNAGPGGNARVTGNRSKAFGGKGGRGGIGKGGRGGDATVTGDGSIAAGGKGGNAASSRKG
jgi:membrane protein implicated in regulation of membrane protease activity